MKKRRLIASREPPVADRAKTLLDLLVCRGIAVNAACGGEGRCGKCLVRIERPRPPDVIEKRLIAGPRLQQGFRLACRYPARGARFEIPSSGRCRPEMPADNRYGIALDLGTTTLKGAVVDLASARIVGRAAIFNPQNCLGGDVLTRIGQALAGKEKLLRRALADGIRKIHARLRVGRKCFTAVAGNTVMESFYLGKSVAGLSRYPFKSEISNGILQKKPARYIFPVIGGFVGGDTVSGLLASGLLKYPGNFLYIDLGTNGEVVLGSGCKGWAVSTAAGPAFEGLGIKTGCLAQPGAIDRVTYTRRLNFRTIGDRPPIGFCASGILDALAVARRQNWLTADGRLRKEISVGGLTLNQHDVRALQLAIAAIHSGIRVLMTKANLNPHQIGRAVITGEFGSRLDPGSLIRIGLIPRGIRDVRLENDLALKGAVEVVRDRALIRTARHIKSRFRHRELALEPDFQNVYIKALRIEPWQ